MLSRILCIHRVGYCGGKKKSPTYHSIGNYTETIQIEYDAKVISYEDLLKTFWRSHTPVGPYTPSTQYMSVIFYHNMAQKKAAEETKAAYAKRRSRLTRKIS